MGGAFIWKSDEASPNKSPTPWGFSQGSTVHISNLLCSTNPKIFRFPRLWRILKPNLTMLSESESLDSARFDFGILTIIGESRTLLRRGTKTLDPHSKKFCPKQLRKSKRLKIYDPVSIMKNAPSIGDSIIKCSTNLAF